MKTSIATAVSIAGVLAAGGAAFAVNSHVMDPTTPSAQLATSPTFAAAAGGLGATATTLTVAGSKDTASGAVSKDGSGADSMSTDTAPVVAPPTTSATPVADPSPTSTAIAPPATAAPTTAPSNLSTTFKVGSSGTVIAAAVAGVVTIESVSPAKGWTATRPRPVANGVEVDFISGSARVDFIVQLLDGKLTGAVNSRTVEDDDRWDNQRHHDDDDDDDREEHEGREEHEDDD